MRNEEVNARRLHMRIQLHNSSFLVPHSSLHLFFGLNWVVGETHPERAGLFGPVKNLIENPANEKEIMFTASLTDTDTTAGKLSAFSGPSCAFSGFG